MTVWKVEHYSNLSQGGGVMVNVFPSQWGEPCRAEVVICQCRHPHLDFSGDSFLMLKGKIYVTLEECSSLDILFFDPLHSASPRLICNLPLEVVPVVPVLRLRRFKQREVLSPKQPLAQCPPHAQH